jgi:GAF domain-containing protein/methyl-accepting chemotaxis protein
VDPIRNTLSTSEAERHLVPTFWLSVLFAIILAWLNINVIRLDKNEMLWATVPAFLVVIASIWLTNNDRLLSGSSMLIVAVGLLAVLSPLFQGSLQPLLALGTLATIWILGLVTLPRSYSGRVFIAGIGIAIGSLLTEAFARKEHAQSGYPVIFWIVAAISFVILMFYLSREFSGLNIRTKIVLAILATGGVALAIFTIFVVNQTQKITNSLSGRLESNVSRLAEEQLTSRVSNLANQADQSFGEVRQEVESFARDWASLQNQTQTLGQGSYWDAHTKLAQLTDGQYGNSSTDVSSVYVPTGITLTDKLYTEINSSAYLDFYAPGVLQANSALIALYAIDTQGVTRYYPNINLASVVPAGFNPATRAYYQITSPLFNPQRLSRWSIPYVDATGAGLVVTVTSPVYQGNTFTGIVAADMQLSQITQQVQDLKIGQTGYAFMIDEAGRILSMSPAGYQFFGLKPEDFKREDFFKQTLIGAGSDQLQAVVRRMAAGGNGLLIVNANGVDNYIAFSPIRTNGYSLALVVPVSELQGAIVAARNETQAGIQSSIRVLAIILISLLFLAIFISLVIGQVISGPIITLTHVANQIVAGDLSAQAVITGRDEIGSLSEAFNTMTSRLRDLLQELEHRVEQRTAELASANEKSERRAQQFESIAQMAATISSTRDLNVLLPQITTAISSQFGFYHAGIFLLDSRKEYAVLSAANSEGGQKMLLNNHRLRVGETGIVGYVTSTGKPRVALNTGQDSVFFNNPFLPETRSEIALPLKVGEEIIGALDVQSTLENAFGQEDINILTTLADQVAIAIQNARQYEETKKALAESAATARQFVQTGWQHFTKSQKIAGIHHTGAKATILYSNNGDGSQNFPTREQSRTKNRGVSLSLPIKLRGEVIGVVDVHSTDNRKWDQDELDIVAAIIERAAIAMENARLLSESQKRASKERTISDISAKISGQSNIDQLIKVVAQELSRTLPGADVAIQFSRNEELE